MTTPYIERGGGVRREADRKRREIKGVFEKIGV